MKYFFSKNANSAFAKAALFTLIILLVSVQPAYASQGLWNDVKSGFGRFLDKLEVVFTNTTPTSVTEEDADNKFGEMGSVLSNLKTVIAQVEKAQEGQSAQVISAGVEPTAQLADFYPMNGTLLRLGVKIENQDGIHVPELKGTNKLSVIKFDIYGMQSAISDSAEVMFMLNGVPISPRIKTPFTYSWDTTGVPDGTHVLSVLLTDGDGDLSQLRMEPMVVVVDNVAGPITGTQSVPSIGSRHFGTITKFAPTWLTVDGYTRRHPATVPYLAPVAPAAHTLQNPNDGLDSNKWFLEPLTQTSVGLYEDLPALYRTKTGHLVIKNSPHQMGAEAASSEPGILARTQIDGPRNANEVTAYSTYVPNPVGRGWVGVDIAGRVFRINPDGSVETIAGRKANRDVVPYLPEDRRVTEADRRALYISMVGTFEGGVEFNVPHDLAYDPRNSNILYVADTENHRIAKIDLSQNPPRISTYAGVPKSSGNIDGPAASAKFHTPASIVVASDGTLYVADSENDSIRSISPDGSTVSTVIDNSTGLNDPFTIREDSEGNLIAAEKAAGIISRISPSLKTRTVITNSCNAGWVWLDVDKKGNVGPKDDIFYVCGTGGSNTLFYRMAKDGSRQSQPGLVGPWVLRFGLVNQVFEPQGHYPWVIAIDDEEARMIMHGFGNSAPHSLRMRLPGDNAQSDTWPKYHDGNDIMTKGPFGFPAGARPSIQALRFHGITQLPVPTFDELALMSDAQLGAYIQGGFGGSVPLPELTGRDLAVAIHSLRLQSVKSLATPPTYTYSSNDSTGPVISDVSVTLVSGDTAKVAWTTNEPTLGFVQFGSAPTHHRWSDIESGYSTTHEVLLKYLPLNKDVHFAIRSKDQTGNQTLTVNRKFSSGGGGPTPPPASAPTLTFSSNLTTVNSGGSATLTWTATNATNCTASGAWSGAKVIGGTQVVTPVETGSYILTCTGSGGSTSQTVTLNVVRTEVPVTPVTPVTPVVPSCTITSNVLQVSPGGTAVLSWVTTNAEQVSLDGRSVAGNSSLSVTPTTTTLYRMTVTASDRSGDCSVTVRVSGGTTPGDIGTGIGTTTSTVRPNNDPSVPLILRGDVYAVRSGLWSATSTWSSGAIPSKTNNVQISGYTVQYDLPFNQSAEAEARSVVISDSGKLVFSRVQSTRLDLDGSLSVLKDGVLDIGTVASPIPGNIQAYVGLNVADDRLFRTNTRSPVIPTETDFKPEDTGLWVTAGGRMDINGSPKPQVWSKLAATAATGTNLLVLEKSPTGWRLGDRVVVTPTGKSADQVEIKTISAIQGKRITLSAPLAYTHESESYGVGISSGVVRKLPNGSAEIKDGEKLVRVQGEVGLLTQNVTIASNLVKAGDTNHRSHTFYLKDASGSLSYAEFRDLGTRGKLGRYPVHLHLMGASAKNFPVTGLSVWNQYEPGNKFMVLHMATGAVVRDNVGYNAQGRGFYMETADETGNIMENNLGVNVYGPEEIPNTIPVVAAVQQLTRPGIFWVRAGNTIRNNVAVGGHEDVGGFWITPNVLSNVPVSNISGNEVRSSEFGLYFSGNMRMREKVSDSLLVRTKKAVWSDDPEADPVLEGVTIVENEQVGTQFPRLTSVLNVTSLSGAVRSAPAPNPAKMAQCTLEVTPNIVRAGQKVTLRWATQNAVSQTISQGIGAVAEKDKLKLVINQNTDFVLTASGTANQVTCAASVGIENPGEMLDHGGGVHDGHKGTRAKKEKARSSQEVSTKDEPGTSGGSGGSKLKQEKLNKIKEKVESYQAEIAKVKENEKQSEAQQKRKIKALDRKLAPLLKELESAAAPTQNVKANIPTPGTIVKDQPRPAVATLTFTRNLGPGDRGNDVMVLQRYLARDRLIYPEGTVTGFYGLNTKRAVERLQLKYGLTKRGLPTVTGYGLVGPKTREFLNREVSQ